MSSKSGNDRCNTQWTSIDSPRFFRMNSGTTWSCNYARRRGRSRLNIAEGSGCTTDGEFVRFLGYAYRSLKEVVTCLELCERLYSTGERQALAVLIDEGNQISRMTHTLIRRLGHADHGVRSVSDS